MTYGSDTLRIIEEQLSQADRQTGAATAHLEALNRRLGEIRARIGEEIRRLAKFRLDELGANQVIARLDETDRKAVDLFAQRSQAQAEAKRRIAASLENQERLKTERVQQTQQRDALLKQLDDTAAEVKAELVRQEAYQAREKHAAETAARVARSEEKANQAEADRAAKGKPYENDPLFMYLWQRRFLTSQYKAGPLTRSLDGWVARMIGFDAARRNYYMLTQLPLHLRDHAERQAALAAEEDRKLRGMEAEALEAKGIAQLRQALQKSQEATDKLEERIEAAENQYETLLQALADFAAGSDEFSRRAMALQVADIGEGSITELYKEAQMTAKADDDLIVKRLRDLREEEKKVTTEIRQFETDLARRRQGFREMEDLRRRFRRNQYDSGLSYFPKEFDIGALLGMLLGGALSGGAAWERIRRQQAFRRPRTPANFGGGVFPAGFPNRAGRGGGASPRGGFGGGAFGSGGGFGGGGFRTGGRM
jgi:chromosome segregation ATPase